MQNIDKRIIDLLDKRGIKSQQEIEEYFNPSISLLCNPFSIDGMKGAAERINQAITNKESVVIYGDYDTDGVCSAAILYLYLKKRGLTPQVYIPNRFEDGYGLSKETITYIAENLFPDLIITVDCGITAVDEINELNDIGIDVVVTDHHLPGEMLPNAVAIVDAKTNINNPFTDYCGAGVALKLICALGGKAEDYVDIAAVATIGDIVPLIKENRIIATIGLAKFNSVSCNMGLAALKEVVLNTNRYLAQDVAYKIVPRLNAAGRMESAILAFNLLVAENREEAKQLAQKLEDVNSQRIEAINQSIEEINKIIYNELDCNCIVVSSPLFHEGVLGILASRIVSEYKKPAFIFKENKDGIMKGSCRAGEDVDLFAALTKLDGLFVQMGGHKQAAGITIRKENFVAFKSVINQELASTNKFISDEPKYDFELSDKELSLDIAKQIEMLEPTGCGNEKPIIKIALNNCTYKKSSNPKHYQLITPSKNYFMCFSGKKYEQIMNSGNIDLYFTVGTEIYNNQLRLKTKVEYIASNKISFENEDEDLALVCDVIETLNENGDIHFLPTKNNCLEAAEKCNKLGTLIIARTKSEVEEASHKLNLPIKNIIPTDQQSCILFAPNSYIEDENVQKYKNLIILSGSFMQKSHNFCKNVITYYKQPNVKKDKQIFADCYRIFSSQTVPAQNDAYEYVAEIKKYLPYSSVQIAFCLSVFIELGFFDYESNGNFLLRANALKKKRDLFESNIYKSIKEN